MPGRRAVIVAVGTLAVIGTGCVAAMVETRPAGYWVASRPDPSYYCYDCHGYRYLDPYYDYCVKNGYRIEWDRSPRLIEQYRQRYVALKEHDRSLGRYRYPQGYRASSRYRESRGYVEDSGVQVSSPRVRERTRDPAAPSREDGTDTRSPRDVRKQKPRGPRPRGFES